MAVLKLCFGSYLLLFSLFPVSDGAVTSPKDQEACVGDNVTIPWEYDDADADIVSVVWRVNTSTDVMTYFGTTRDPVNGYNVVASNDNGSITITSATRSNSGTYRIDVTATQASSDQVEVIICEPSETGLKGTKSGSELKCEASNLGDPEAELYIKVNGKEKNSSSAEVRWFDIVHCCLRGCAVQCMSGKNKHCKLVRHPTTTSTTTSSSTTPAPNPNQTVYIVIGAIVGTILIICIILCCWCVRRRRSKQKNDNIQIGNIKKKVGYTGSHF